MKQAFKNLKWMSFNNKIIYESLLEKFLENLTGEYSKKSSEKLIKNNILKF
ncbi:hypothetical protein CLERM_267 [Coxiella-like endosymbiont]|nr:hypothetical protein CLERM_267 [Coxiella-like endosymbiont]